MPIAQKNDRRGANRDRVELGHVLRCVLEDVGDDLHRELRRIDVRVTYHELLENIVLDRTGKLIERAALLQTGHDVECHDRKYGAVHGHRHRHLVERNAVEQNLHVLYRADRHTGLADVTYNTRVIGVVTAVRGEVECHRQTLLSGSKVAAVECVGLLGGRETCILTYGPGTHYVHRRIGTAQERSYAGGIVEVLHALEVFSRIGSFDGYPFGSQPRLLSSGFFGAAALGSVAFVCKI